MALEGSQRFFKGTNASGLWVWTLDPICAKLPRQALPVCCRYVCVCLQGLGNAAVLDWSEPCVLANAASY